jgi:hypothetical protein
MGRPSSYTPEIADAICERLAAGETLKAICTDDAMPGETTVFRWLAASAEFRELYARAREAQAELMADEIIKISDDGANDTYTDEDGNTRTDYDVVNRSKLRVDTRKWLMAKRLPKRYGERTILTGDNDGDAIKVDVEDARTKLRSLIKSRA